MPDRATIESWTIPGADGEPIYGDAHIPKGVPRGIIIIAHGFKGYKDYGMFPRIAGELAGRGFVTHRFNFSHSGMTNKIDTFERTDLFEKDTFNKQVFDLRRVIEESAPGGLPFVLFGHSRGGIATLLTAGRFANDDRFPQPAGIVTAASPAHANNLDDAQQKLMLKQGFIASPSSRTGQELRVGRAWLEEQLNDPAGHDVLAMVKRIKCPMSFIHGTDDSSVPVGDVDLLGEAAGANGRVVKIAGGDHVFNVKNPLERDQASSAQLQTLIDETGGFAEGVCADSGD